MLNFINRIESISDALSDKLKSLSYEHPNACRSVITEIDYCSNQTRILEGFEKDLSLGIYGKIGYEEGQDSKTAFRRPGIIQVSHTHQCNILPFIEEYNAVKLEIKSFHKRCLSQWPSDIVKDLWQSSRSMLNLKQLFRALQFKSCSLRYAGLSVVTKPVVKKLSKQEALDIISIKREHVPWGTDMKQFMDYLDKKERELASMDESKYTFRLARKGAPRPVLNTRDKYGRTAQLMASMPVIVFTDTFVDVSLPKPKKSRVRRSDAFINLDPVAGNQIKAIPVILS